MICTKKIFSFALTLFFAGASVVLYAQVPQSSQPTQSPTMNQPTQMQPPTQQSPMDQNQPSTMDQQPQSQNPDLNLNQSQATSRVSDKELKAFATVYPRVQSESQKAQQQMAAVIEKDGMELNRFNEIATAELQNKKSDATKEEKKTYDKITKELDAMQPEIQKNIESVITSSGLSVERFQAIAFAIQNDKDLQSRFQKIMNGGNLDS
jgi:hypothetical protein